ncbi:MAG: chorismate mutase [Kiritimatiellaeota bacterium]|nr:chorismate mutase [Kiritimatiellota bacterium]
MSIDKLRVEIDTIDDQLIDLFERRMQVALEVARHKKESGRPVCDNVRERQLLHDVSGKVDTEFGVYTRVLFSTLMDLSRSYQHKLLAGESKLRGAIGAAIEQTPKLFPERAVIACQGAEGARAQAACDKLFVTPSIMYFNTFEGVFKAVGQGLCRYGVLPIEDNSEGSVNAVYDLLRQHKVSIVRSARLQTGAPQDGGANYTRFICISSNLEIYPGANRTSLMLLIPHQSGSLYRVLMRFYALDMSLMKIESRPLQGRNFEFMFYFDVDASIYSPALLQLICELENQIPDFRYLGSYTEVV